MTASEIADAAEANTKDHQREASGGSRTQKITSAKRPVI
jgi:hypothetical protein